MPFMALSGRGKRKCDSLFPSFAITYGDRKWRHLTAMDGGNAGFAGAKTCPCAAGTSELIRGSLADVQAS
jgi:hypothetical protein